MPNISEYLLRTFGISVFMYFIDRGQHNAAHIHVKYQGEEAVIGIPGGELLKGSLPNRVLRKVRAWIELNDETLIATWEKARNGQTFSPID